ncbi:hypothetical protein Acr_26g0009430 [Actinidia rufa]|uniref:Exocyst component Exo84 C-terminal domain-containing protein n=1 Tax=Actinidia rufa TaxID=165716 RepID=A0A7J0H3J1_9ERIC|nr:hypothetical protein Acr_26g0009430 [Actinidia rufa]
MESSSSSASRFRFRDHQATGDGGATEGHTSPDTWSVSRECVDEPEIEIESMTGKGIKHLCSELLELKRISDEDFHKNVFSNYSAFVRIFQEVEGMENELMQLKHHVSTQKRLVKELIDGIYLEVLSKETVESIIDGFTLIEPYSQSTLEAHTDDVSEVLDVLLSERRLDEALAIVELEVGTFRHMQLQANLPPNVLTRYDSAISERRKMIADQLKLVAGNPRVSASELLKSLVGLCRLGDSHLATQLLLKYYHSRIASGIHDLQYKSANGAYIHEVSKFVFSLISQAAKSFSAFYGETSSYSSEFMQWACDETKLFAACFNKYVRSISEISGGLVSVVEAVQSALSYCSLLETQKMALCPCLVKHIFPCVEEVLQIHIDHGKKVIAIFTSTDTWAVGKYLLSGILSEGYSSVVIGQRLEYCLLTNSGRKFVTLLQAITEDASPLVSIQMEGSILRGLMDLFMEYLTILEIALTGKGNGLDKGGPGVNLAKLPEQEVAIVANLSTLVQLFSSIVKSVFKGINHLNFEVDSFMSHIQEASDRLRAHFCQQFICRLMYGSDCKLAPETWVGGHSDADTSDVVIPSVVFQGLFLELRKLEKLAEDNFVQVDQFLELMRELMETIFSSISNNEELWTTIKKDLAVQHCGNFKQFTLDMEFLVEISRGGGYFNNNMTTAVLALLSRMESTFISAGLDPRRDTIDGQWAVNAAKEALQTLREMEETKSPPNGTTDDLEVTTEEDLSAYDSDSFEGSVNASSLGDSVESTKSSVINASEVVFTTDGETSRTEVIPPEDDVNSKPDGCSDDRKIINSDDAVIESEDTEAEHVVDGMLDMTSIPQEREQQLSVGNDGKAYGERSA